MAIISEPVARRRPSKASEPVAPARRRNHRREEIVGIIAFCAAMLFVILMRNYAS
jgi:hypothetical protein